MPPSAAGTGPADRSRSHVPGAAKGGVRQAGDAGDVDAPSIEAVDDGAVAGEPAALHFVRLVDVGIWIRIAPPLPTNLPVPVASKTWPAAILAMT